MNDPDRPKQTSTPRKPMTTEQIRARYADMALALLSLQPDLQAQDAKLLGLLQMKRQ